MSTNATALPQRTLRPFLAGALTAMLMAGLVIGIALAINLSANRTSQATQKAVPVVVNDTYQEHRSGVIVPPAGVAPDTSNAGAFDRWYAQVSGKSSAVDQKAWPTT